MWCAGGGHHPATNSHLIRDKPQLLPIDTIMSRLQCTDNQLWHYTRQCSMIC